MYITKATLLLLSVFALASPLSYAKKAPIVYPHITVASVTSIYDGDTFRVNIQGYPAVIGQNIPIRVNGIDTPEIRGKCPSEKRLAREAKQLTVKSLREAKQVELRNIKRGKYFRLVADVYVDGKSLGDILLAANLAYRYDAGKKQSWCD